MIALLFEAGQISIKKPVLTAETFRIERATCVYGENAYNFIMPIKSALSHLTSGKLAKRQKTFNDEIHKVSIVTIDPNVPKFPAPRISHELRTPMNHIIGYSELLIEDADDQQLTALSQELRRVRSLGQELLAIINDTFSTLKAGSQVTRLRQSSTMMQSMVSQIASAVTALQISVKSEHEVFLPDLQKIATATQNFSQLVETLAVSNPDEPGDLEPVTHFESGHLVDPGSATLLVVDDNAENRDMLTMLLTRQGYRVLIAEDGSQAMNILESNRCDLILLDIMMPVMDGFEVLTRAKASPKLREIPIIVLSALDDLNDTVRCIELGAEDYLSKPFNPVLLRARLGTCLEKKRLRDVELAYLREVDRLTYAAVAVENESFEPDSLVDLADRPDALGQLARVFVRMAHEIYAREAQLKKLSALRVTLDEALLNQTVGNIISTPYFKQLGQLRHKPDRELKR